ncbi:MAG: hypothetical protein HYV63_29755 [Candidatus Schekmanbacteria bacterium]|nr:hypothetical protein [Candidatus Schekmanbacteria bacterium]
MSVMSLRLKACAYLLVLATNAAIANGDPVFDALRLRLECQDDEVTFGEPAWFFMSMYNSSNNTISINPGVIYNAILLCSLDAVEYSPCVYERMFSDFLDHLDMYPGRVVWKGEVRLYLKGTPRTDLKRQDGYVNDLVFPGPGTYYVKAVSGDAENLHSNAIRLTVALLPESERPVMEIWSRPEVARFMNGQTITSKEGVEPLERLLEQYPDSLYADHARYALGYYWSSQHFRDSSGTRTDRTADPPMLRKAYKLVSGVTDRIPILKLRALYRQLEIVGGNLFMHDHVDVKSLAAEVQSRMSLADRIGLGEKMREWLQRLLAREEPTETLGAAPR